MLSRIDSGIGGTHAIERQTRTGEQMPKMSVVAILTIMACVGTTGSRAGPGDAAAAESGDDSCCIVCMATVIVTRVRPARHHSLTLPSPQAGMTGTAQSWPRRWRVIMWRFGAWRVQCTVGRGRGAGRTDASRCTRARGAGT